MQKRRLRLPKPPQNLLPAHIQKMPHGRRDEPPFSVGHRQRPRGARLPQPQAHGLGAGVLVHERFGEKGHALPVDGHFIQKIPLGAFKSHLRLKTCLAAQALHHAAEHELLRDHQQRLRAQTGKADAPRSRQRMVPTHHRHDLRPHGGLRHIVLPAHRLQQHAQIQLAQFQKGEDLAGGHLHDLQRDLGIGRAELADEGVVVNGAGGGGNANAEGVGGADPLAQLAGLAVHKGEDPLGVLAEQLAAGGKGEVLGGAVDEVGAELLLQQAHALAQSRLADMEQLRRAGKAALAHYLGEILQLIQRHGLPSPALQRTFLIGALLHAASQLIRLLHGGGVFHLARLIHAAAFVGLLIVGNTLYIITIL